MEVVGRCSGVVLMAPPDDSAEARATIATLLSALKSKQKVTAAFHHLIHGRAVKALQHLHNVHSAAA